MYQTNYITYIKLEKPTGQSSMDNSETRTMLGTRHRTNTKNKINQHRKEKYRVDTHNSQKKHRCEPRCSRRVGSSCFLLDTRHVTHGQASDEYAYVWMMQPMSYTEQMQGSLLSWKTSWHLCHAMNECRVAKCHDKFLMLVLMFEWCTVVYFHEKHFDTCVIHWTDVR